MSAARNGKADLSAWDFMRVFVLVSSVATVGGLAAIVAIEAWHTGGMISGRLMAYMLVFPFPMAIAGYFAVLSARE